MKDSYYFSHDSNARHDPNILALRSVYGVKGYGWFWIILEVMREESDYCLTVDKYLYNAMALEMQCNCITAEKFINDCIEEFKLFIKKDNKIFSESLIERMKKVDEKIEKARESANKRWGKNDEIKIETDVKNANAMPTQCDSNAINESKGKESKRKESKVNNKDIYPPKIKYSDFVSMTEEENQKLIDKYGKDNTLAFIEKLNIWKGANGKQKAKGSDYLKILNWVVEAVLEKGLNKGGVKGAGNTSNNSGSNKRFENERTYTDEEQQRIDSKFYS
ncbi:MAG: Lin1244/Lin1753 domain-containing protein [Candidatus Humimicrobiaceae bacterium]